MKKNNLVLIVMVLLSMASSFAQHIPPASIEDSVIGWMKVYKFTGVKKAVQAALLPKTISFIKGSNSGENDQFFISNLKIVKN